VDRFPSSKASFTDAWELSELTAFVRSHAYPLISELTEETVNHLSEHHIVTLLGVIVPEHFLTDLKHIAEDIEAPFPVTYVAYSDVGRVLKGFYVDVETLPKLLLFDPAQNRWITYDGVLTDTQLNRWVKVLDLREAQWSGPHDNLGEAFSALVWEANPFWVLAMAGSAIYGLLKCWRERNIPKPKNRRPSDFEFTPL
jgi:hypothetical protein